MVFILKISKRLAMALAPVNKFNIFYDIFWFKNYRFKHLSAIRAISVIAIPNSLEMVIPITKIDERKKLKSNRFFITGARFLLSACVFKW